MGRSFGLAAYRALSRRSTDRIFKPSAERPSGSVIWIHAPEPDSLPAIEDLAQRLCAARPGLSIVITLTDGDLFKRIQENSARSAILRELVPSEHPEAVAAFWKHWDPDMGLWAWGRLRPNLLTEAHNRQCAMVLIDADTAGFDGRRDRWLPDFSFQLLQPFISFMVRSDEALQLLQTIGLPRTRINLTTPLEAGGQTLPCKDRDLSDLSTRLRGRPVWFANTIRTEEISAVLMAHREALRLAHRLLLIMHLADETDISEARTQCVDQGFRAASWSDGEDLDDATQVLFVRDESDLGLFYRASPISFMGSSMTTGKIGRNPLEAAALGSAVLHGPDVGHLQTFYERLLEVGAARMVKDEKSLGQAVTHLLAPEKAAAMAHAGWDVASQGADLTDRVVGLVQAVLDGEMDATNARA